MNDKNIAYGAAGLVIGVLLMWVLAPAIFNGYGMGPMNMWGRRSGPVAMSGNIDRHFIEQMIPHHEDAITMSEIALRRSEHQEIKDLAQSITRTQTDEIEQMKQWYKNWFGQDVPDAFAGTGHGMGSGMMHGGMMGNSTDTSILESVQPFDKAFIEEMIPHHQMAVMMAQMLKSSTTRAEMERLADDIIETQNSEINQMRTWYAQWYGN